MSELADGVLKKHLLLKLTAGKDSNDDRHAAIIDAMEEYRKLGRNYTEDEIRKIQEQAYDEGIKSTGN